MKTALAILLRWSPGFPVQDSADWSAAPWHWRGFLFRAHRSPWDFAAVLMLGAAVLAAVLTYAHYGVPFDEDLQDNYGHLIVEWFRTFGVNHGALEYEDLYFYGGLFDSLAALIDTYSPLGHWETRHLVNALVGIFGVAGCWRLGRYLGGPAVGALSAAFLLTWPTWYGMMFLNPKDIPFAGATVWALYYITRLSDEMPYPSRGVLVKLGLALGAALATRIGGVLPVGYFGLVMLAHLAVGREPVVAKLRRGVRWGLQVVLPVVAIAWVVMVAFWPFAQVAPFSNPLAAFKHFGSFQPDIDTLFFGREVSSAYKPLGYLPTYLTIKTPDVILALLVAGLLMLPRWLLASMPVRVRLRWMALGLSLVVPVAYILITRPELYDAERHFLFLLPPLSVLAAVSALALWRIAADYRRLFVLAAVGAGLVSQVVALVTLHPYQYTYYNSLVGGLPGAFGMFEAEYWASSVSEATDKLTKEILVHMGNQPMTVAVCGNEEGVMPKLPPNVKISDDWEHADFYLSTTRHRCDRDMVGKTVITIERQGVPFAVVKDVRETNAINNAKATAAATGAAAGSASRVTN
ncbi:MAG: hypothetical protein ACM33T_16400 [Solirubrobacterales bacterium]